MKNVLRKYDYPLKLYRVISDKNRKNDAPGLPHGKKNGVPQGFREVC